VSGLISYLSDLSLFQEALTRGAAGRTAVAAPSFVHPLLAAGFLSRNPWKKEPALVVAPDQDTAAELEHELTLYCPDRAVV
jgi:hypothetical protein